MSVGSSNSSLRKALGSIKDTTTINLARVNSDYKELDIAIVKATNHVERPPKERHIRAIFAAVSATRPRADVAYCIHALHRRLSKTHNWAVALKTLMVIHRALREVDPTFHEELINYGRSRGHMLNLSYFKDDSSANAWDYSAWIRSYALYLEEKLECFRILKYDVEADRSKTKDLDEMVLLEQLPSLQQLLYRVLGCQPEGVTAQNFVIQLALSMVASESMNIYNAINDGTINLVDKFFEMPREKAILALDIYRRAGQQAEKLSEFYEICKTFDLCRGERFIKIEQKPPVSFMQAMEEYVRDAPRASTQQKEQVKQVIEEKKVVLAIEDKKDEETKVEERATSPPSEPVKEVKVVAEPPDLLGMDEPNPVALDLDEKNALALAIISVDQQNATATAPSPNMENGSTGWELALVTTPSSTEPTKPATDLGGGFDKLTLDSLYDDAIRRSNQNVSYNPWEQPAAAPQPNPMMNQPAHDPFVASWAVAAHPTVQMASMTNQQHQAYMWQQQQQQQQLMMMGPQYQQPTAPFGNTYYAANPYGSAGVPVPAYNSYAGLS